MTGAVFIIAIAAAWLHYSTAGFFVAPGLTIYVVAFVATLATASVAALVSWNSRAILGAAVLVANFAASHFAWQSENVLLLQAAADIITAGWFILAGVTRWELGVGGIFIISAASAGLAQLGILPFHNRPLVYIAWNYADVASILGHLASVVLGMGAGDVGARTRDRLRARPVVFAYRRELLARLGLGRQVAAD